MSKNRSRLISTYGHRYKKITPVDNGNSNLCFYCGDIYTELDHQPPISLVESIPNRSSGIEYALIPSCSECNSLLRASETYSVSDRYTLLKKLLQAKHANLLQATAEDRDYSGLTGRLKRQCLAYDQKGLDVRARLAFSGYEYYGGQVMASDRYSYDGSLYDSYFDALLAACEARGVNYKKVVVFKKKSDLMDFDKLINQYIQFCICTSTEKLAIGQREERYKKMPIKIIKEKIHQLSNFFSRGEDILNILDEEYVKYLDRMGLNP